MDHSDGKFKDPPPPPRTNRKKVECLKCGKQVNKDNKALHIKLSHLGQSVKFREIPESGQQILNFFPKAQPINVQNNNSVGIINPVVKSTVRLVSTVESSTDELDLNIVIR